MKEITPTKSVLIVDDEPQFTKIIAAYLEEVDCIKSIVRAIDGREAIMKLENQKFDLVILDLHMPKLDGIGVVEYINSRQDGSNQTNVKDVLMLTGYLDKEKIQELLKLGVKAFLVKPCTEEAIIEKANGIFNR